MIKVRVTQEDIENGEPDDCEKCPVALATKRCLGVSWVEVTADQVRFSDWAVMNPDPVKEFVYGFDRGDDVEPFEFELPEDSERRMRRCPECKDYFDPVEIRDSGLCSECEGLDDEAA